MKSWMTALAILLVVTSSVMTSGQTAAQGKSVAIDLIAPQLQQSIQAAASDAMISVIVELKDQEDLRSIKDPERRKRLRKVIDRLQQKSNLTQKRIQRLLRQRAEQGQVTSFQSYWIFNGLEVTATAAVIQELAALAEVAKITANETVLAPTLPVSSKPSEANLLLVNAPALWNLGWQGQGIVVANMDTGVDVTHADLAAKWRGGTNSWFDPYGQHPNSPVDLSGHGTWTMGVMVGGDAGGTSIGMAPASQWIAVKIFNDQGAGTVAGIHAGFQWLLDPDGNPATDDAPQVVNNSWTFQTPSCNLEFAPDLQALRTAGILPIFAAGNSGPGAGSSYSPANNPGAFAVGGVDNNDALYVYSSRGPTTCNGQATFPQLVAPGVDIRSSDLYGLYTTATGTSLAAPHVSGALALLLSAFPNLTATEQEAALLSSAVDLGVSGADNTFGYGRLNVLNAYQALGSMTTNQPPSVDAGVDQTITLPATAQLSGTASDDGLPTPANLVTTWSVVSGPSSVTFGNAGALSTTAGFTVAGVYTLRLTATDGALTASDDLIITVNPAPPVNQPPTANAGPDQTITLPAAATLSGSGSDDGLPTPANLVTTWSVVSGPGSVTFGDAGALSTTAGFTVAGVYTLRLTATDGALTASDDLIITVNSQPASANILYLSASANGTVGGVAFQDEDIIAYNPTTGRWSLVLDGSDVGVGSSDIDAFTILADGTFLISLDSGLTLSGLGAVKDTDILRFSPTSLGNTTAGAFAFYLRGADVGLTTSDEDIDAIAVMPDGRLLVSTLGNVNMQGVSGADEDLIALNLSTGAATLYFDGSKVGLSAGSEDLWGVWVDGTGKLYLSTQGAFAVKGASGSGSDIFTCNLLATGLNTTACTFGSYWQGATYGFSRIIDGFALGGNLPLFSPSVQASAAEAVDDGLSNPDDDPLNGDVETDEAESVAEEDLTQTIFLPLINR